MQNNNRIGFVILGHDDYGTGKGDITLKNSECCINNLKSCGFDVILGKRIVKSSEDARQITLDLLKADLCGFILFPLSWGAISPALIILRELKHIPFCLFGTYGTTVETSTGSMHQCLVLKNILERLKYNFCFIRGEAFDKTNLDKLIYFAKSVSVIKKLSRSRVAIIGSGYSFDMFSEYINLVNLREKLGIEFINLDTYDLLRISKEFDDSKLKPVLSKFNNIYDTKYRLDDKYIRDVCAFYTALKKIKKEYNVDAMNIKCYPELAKSYKCVPCIPMSMLSSFDKVPLACEGAVPITVTMLIFYYFNNTNTIYGDVLENICIKDNCFTLNICGFVPYDLYDASKGLKISEFNCPEADGIVNYCVLKKGELTFGRLFENRNGEISFIFGKGEGKDSNPFLDFMPALNIKVDGNIEELINKIPGHHLALVYTDLINYLKEFSKILNIDYVEI